MDEYLGIIKIFAGNFAPKGWVMCNGQLLSIAQNSALFAILGTTYGGDGVNTFAVPNLQSRIPLGMGAGPGLSRYVQGQVAGTETTTLLTSNMPAHTHAAQVAVSNLNATVATPTATCVPAAAGTGSGRSFVPTNAYIESDPNVTLTKGVTIGSAGGNLPFSNLQPYIAMNYIMCTQGLFPTRE